MSKFFLTIFAAAFVVSACSGQTDSSAQNTTAAPANQAASEIAVTAPYVVPPFPGRDVAAGFFDLTNTCLLYTSPSPRDGLLSRMPSSA